MGGEEGRRVVLTGGKAVVARILRVGICNDFGSGDGEGGGGGGGEVDADRLS